MKVGTDAGGSRGGRRKELGAFLGRGLSVGGREGGRARKGPKIDLPRKRLRSRSFAASVPSCVHTWRKLKKRGKGGRHLGNGKEYGEQDGFFVWESLPAIGCGSQKKKDPQSCLGRDRADGGGYRQSSFLYKKAQRSQRGTIKIQKYMAPRRDLHTVQTHCLFCGLGSPFLCLVSQ